MGARVDLKHPQQRGSEKLIFSQPDNIYATYNLAVKQ